MGLQVRQCGLVIAGIAGDQGSVAKAFRVIREGRDVAICQSHGLLQVTLAVEHDALGQVRVLRRAQLPCPGKVRLGLGKMADFPVHLAPLQIQRLVPGGLGEGLFDRPQLVLMAGMRHHRRSACRRQAQ